MPLSQPQPDGPAGPPTVTPIAENEVGAAVGIFLGAFRDNVRLVYGDDPRPDAMRDVWTFVRQTEPGGFLVARENNDILGYAIFVSSVSALRRKAVRSGAIFGWALRALVGRYGIHWIALARLLWNKTLFVRSSDRFRSEGDAQLLNIAVSPGARGKGIAKLLVHAGLKYLAGEHIQEVRLEVRPENKPAIAAYLANGFVERGRTQDAGGDWIVMTARP